MEIITTEIKECGFRTCFFWPSCERKTKLPFFSLEMEPGKVSFITLLLIKSKWEMLGNVNRYEVIGWEFYSMKSMGYSLLDTEEGPLCRLR